MDYESDMKHYSDHMNALAYARKKGEASGVSIGREEGVGIGVLRTAKNMLAKGFSVADVLKATDLPREQVMALR